MYNAAGHFVQFWDGRAKDLHEQAGGPIENPGEMGSTHPLAIEVLQSEAEAFGTLRDRRLAEGAMWGEELTEEILAKAHGSAVAAR